MALFGINIFDELERINAKVRDDFLKFDERLNEDFALLHKMTAEGLDLIRKKSGDAFNAENIENEERGKEEVADDILLSAQVEVCAMDTDCLVLPNADPITNSQSPTTIGSEPVINAAIPTDSNDDVADQGIEQKKLSRKGSNRGTYALHCLSRGLQGRRSSLMRIASRASTRLSAEAIIANFVGKFDSPTVTGLRASDQFYTCKTKLSRRFKIDEMSQTFYESSDKPECEVERLEQPVLIAVQNFTNTINSDEIGGDNADASSKDVVVPQSSSPAPSYAGARPKVRKAKSKNSNDSRNRSSSSKNRAMPPASSNSAPSMKYKNLRGKKQNMNSSMTRSNSANSARARCISVSNTPKHLTPAEKQTKLEEKSRKNKAAQDVLEADLKQKLEEKRRRREERMRNAQEARLQKEQVNAKKCESEELKRAMVKIKDGSKRPLSKTVPAQATDEEKYENFLKKKREQQIHRQQKLAERIKLENEMIALEKAKAVKDAPKLLMNQTFDVEQFGEDSMVRPPEASTYDITLSKSKSKYVQFQAGDDDYGIQYLHSDDSTDEESKPKKKIPSWASGKPFYRLILMQDNANIDIEKLFPPDILLALPDLELIFDYCHQKLRVRTSSAHWSSPPCHEQDAITKSQYF